MTTLLSVVNYIDNTIFNLRSTVLAMGEATQEGDIPSLIQIGISAGQKTAVLAQYTLTGLKYISNLGYLIEQSLQRTPSYFSHLFQMAKVTQSIAGIGIAINILSFLRESVAVIRQQRFHSIFKENVTGLEEIAYYSQSSLKNVLPKWLYEEWKTNRLLEIELCAKIREYSFRKQVMHVIGWIGTTLTLLAFIGTFVAFPPTVIAILMAAGFAFMVTQYVIKKGWVDNPDEAFSWKLCLPEFIRKRLFKPEKGIPSYSSYYPLNIALCNLASFNQMKT